MPYFRRGPKGRRWTKWSDEELRDAVATSNNYSNVLRRLGIIPAGGNFATIQRRIRELSLDTSGDAPVLMGHVSRMRGRRLIETEHPISGRAVEETTDEDVLAFLLREIEPFVSR